LDNLVGIVDCNRLAQAGTSIDEHNTDVMERKWQAFGWDVRVIDGHDMQAIIEAFDWAAGVQGKPAMIIAKTFKGFGLVGQQDQEGFHGKPVPEEKRDALVEQLYQTFSHVRDYKPAPFTPTQPETFSPKTEKKLANVFDITSDQNAALFAQGEKLATRKAFGYGLAALGRINKDVFTLDGDVKNSTFTEIFEKEHPERFVQCYVAEQNMISVSTGLQLRGKIPFAATFAAFFSRAYDQVRMAGVGRNALRLAGSHAGVSIGEDGPSQMGLEDLAMMRAVPRSIVLYPSDAVAAYKLVGSMASYDDGLSYMRTTRATTPILYHLSEEFPVGGCKILKQSEQDVACIVTAGITLHEALKAYETLAQNKIFVAVIDAYSIKPLDEKTIKKVASQSNNRIITVEDHYLQGGLGEAVSAAFVNDKLHIETLAVTDISRSGTSAQLLAHAGIDASAIVEKIKALSFA